MATDGSYAGDAALHTVITASVVSDILIQFKTSEVFALSDRSTKAKQLANTVLEKIGEDVEEMRQFSQELNEHLLHVVDDNQGCSKLTTTKEKMWRQFHAIRCKELKILWSKFSNSLVLSNEDPLLSQYIFEEGFRRVIDYKFKGVEVTNTIKDLTWEEHNALRYTSGYVPYSLMKKIRRTSGPHNSDFLACLSEMGANDSCSGEESFLDFTKMWILSKYRGGLFLIKDEVDSFFLELEKKTREYLPKLITPKLTKADTVEDLCKDDNVQFEWCMLSTGIEEELASQELLKKIIDLWLIIRGFSYAGAYVEQYKQCTKLSTKKTVGLRKGLKRKRSEIEQ